MSDPTVPVIDGHIDVLLRLQRPRAGEERSFFERSSLGHVDLPRAHDGGMSAAFFAVFVPDKSRDRSGAEGTVSAGTAQARHAPVDALYARTFTEQTLALAAHLEADSDGALRRVLRPDDLAPCLAGECLGMILHLEGAEAVEPGLGNLARLHAEGVRSIGIVWSRPNAFGNGVPFRHPGHPDIGAGLTPAGRSLVDACGDMGILVDVAHLNERGFLDVVARSRAPVVCTHGAVHALCPSARNLTDGQLDAIAASRGVVGITLGVQDLRADGRSDAATPIETVARHYAYVAERIGAEHLAIGTDFDGATVPAAIGGADGLPRLVEGLRAIGFGADDLRGIASGNWHRVLEATWH